MKRSKAADLIDEIRAVAGGSGPPDRDVREILTDILANYNLAPLQRCHGEAHSNCFIDNCIVCAPRWGWVGKKEPVT